MTANSLVKYTTFAVIGGLIYYALSTPINLKEFERQSLSQPTVNQFSEDFEKINDVQDLFASDFSRWHQLSLQNNEIKLLKNPTKNCFIDAEECVMTDNRIEISPKKKRRGKQSLKFTAQSTLQSLGRESKIGIRRHLFRFGEGSDFYFSTWLYLEDETESKSKNSQNLKFMGLRSAASSWRYRKEPGRFLLFDRNNYIASDLLYWLPKPEVYKQEILEEVSVPLNKWVNIRMHIHLSNSKEGLVQVWQDEDKILYYPGQTLPKGDTIYSLLELGILGHQDSDDTQVLYLDEIKVSDEPFFKL